MICFSTRDPERVRPTPLRDAVLQGLAPDGGLYLPAEIPTLPEDSHTTLAGTPFRESAYVMARLWLEETLGRERVDALVAEALDFPIPMVPLQGGPHLLELFHGPTASFKDVGARFLAALLSHLRREEEGERIVILTATSGDTGGAVAHAVGHLPGVEAVILYPEGRISELQLRQIVEAPGAEEGRVRGVAVRGSFDDCQRIVKGLLAHPPEGVQVTLTTANSVNLGRLLPQTFYYLHARAGWSEEGDPWVSVPSGNLGNLTAGVLARRMGLPLAGFVAACNENRPLTRGRGWTGSGKASHPTLSSAMDITAPSNLERLRTLYRDDAAAMEGEVTPQTISEVATLRVMRKGWRQYGYLVDPHGAVGWGALQSASPHGDRGIVLATAHPGKFPEAVREAVRVDPFPPPGWTGDTGFPTPWLRISADGWGVERAIAGTR